MSLLRRVASDCCAEGQAGNSKRYRVIECSVPSSLERGVRAWAWQSNGVMQIERKTRGFDGIRYIPCCPQVCCMLLVLSGWQCDPWGVVAEIKVVQRNCDVISQAVMTPEATI